MILTLEDIFDAMMDGDCPVETNNMLHLKELAMMARLKAILAYMNASTAQLKATGSFSDSVIMATAVGLTNAIIEDDALALMQLMDDIDVYSDSVEIPARYFKPCAATLKYIGMAMAMEIETMHELGPRYLFCDKECDTGEWKEMLQQLRDEDEDDEDKGDEDDEDAKERSGDGRH